MDAALLGALAAFARACADQLPLKLGRPTHDCTEEGDALSLWTGDRGSFRLVVAYAVGGPVDH
jgi:hypothetical protein